MPLFPYRVEEPVRTMLPVEVREALEHWINYGVGEIPRERNPFLGAFHYCTWRAFRALSRSYIGSLRSAC
jgi:hypothetical protein